MGRRVELRWCPFDNSMREQRSILDETDRFKSVEIVVGVDKHAVARLQGLGQLRQALCGVMWWIDGRMEDEHDGPPILLLMQDEPLKGRKIVETIVELYHYGIDTGPVHGPSKLVKE